MFLGLKVSIFAKIFFMNYLANIYTKSKLELEPFFNIVDDENKIIDGIPTLIVGWDSVKSLYGEVNILEKKVKNNVYWTFGKRERRNIMEVDLQRFKKDSVSMATKFVKYRFFNILTAENEKKKGFYTMLKDSRHKTVFSFNNMLYIYVEGTNTVVAISLRDVEYVGGDIKKIFSTLYNNKFVKVANDDELKSTNAKFFFKDNIYLIPYIFS